MTSLPAVVAFSVYLMVLLIGVLVLLAAALRLCSAINGHPQDREGVLRPASMFFGVLGVVVLLVIGLYLAMHPATLTTVITGIGAACTVVFAFAFFHWLNFGFKSSQPQIIYVDYHTGEVLEAKSSGEIPQYSQITRLTRQSTELVRR